MKLNKIILVNLVKKAAITLFIAAPLMGILPPFVQTASAALVTTACYSGGPTDPSPNNVANLLCACPTTGCTGSPGGVISTPDPVPNAPDPNAEFKGFGTKFRATHKDDCTTLTVIDCGILHWIIIITNTLSIMVGVIVVAVIVAGGIQYTAAGDDPQKVQAAKTRITNAIIALVVSIFMTVFLNWIIPGGVL